MSFPGLLGFRRLLLPDIRYFDGIGTDHGKQPPNVTVESEKEHQLVAVRVGAGPC